MSLCLTAFTTSFAFSKAVINLDEIGCSDSASEILWDYILKTTQLNEKIAAIHKIYKEDSKAVFFDLDDDGKDEIIGTHLASRTSAVGLGLHLGVKNSSMYVLKKDGDSYKEIGGDLYFNSHRPIRILNKKNDGYRIIQVYGNENPEAVDFVFDKKKGRYIDKDSVNLLPSKIYAKKVGVKI